jgi:hypothetical protein
MDVLKLDRILGTTTLSGNSFAASRSPTALEQGFEGLSDLYEVGEWYCSSYRSCNIINIE